MYAYNLPLFIFQSFSGNLNTTSINEELHELTRTKGWINISLNSIIRHGIYSGISFVGTKRLKLVGLQQIRDHCFKEKINYMYFYIHKSL
jgi:hypothetical protein